MNRFYINGKIACDTLYDFGFMDAWVLLEKHDPSVCDCSYCQRRKSESPKIKLWLPECRERNCWRVLCWNRNGYYYFLRSTLPTWRWFANFDKWNNGWRFNSMSIGKNGARSLISVSKNSPLPRKFKYLESILWITFKSKVKMSSGNFCSGCSQNPT